MKFINNKLALAVCIALSVSACAPDKTSEEHISAAKININNSEHNAAIIALKSAVRADLKNAEARVLLGTLYLEMGDAASGEKELSRAIELNGDIDNTLPKLLKALNLQNKSKETISLIDKHEKITPEILLYQALAYNKLNQKDKAKLSIAQANDISTESIYSQLGQAYLKADSLDVDGALENIDKILVTDPNLTEALILKGQLHFAKKEYENAIVAFNKYHHLLPRNVQIRLFLANAYVRNEQFEQANEHLDFLLKITPEHPFINQLKGFVYYQNNDYTQALNHTKTAIQNGISSVSSRIVAGLSAFKLERYELAHEYLAALPDLPSNHPVQRVLALVQMQLGYSTNASITLAELEELTPQDVNLITNASFALLKEGKMGEAKKLLAKTSGTLSDTSQGLTKIGILQLSMNDLEGLTNLEKAVEMDPELPMAKVALAAAYIKTNEFDKALALAEAWKKSHPEKIEGYNLAAKVQLLKNDKAAAEVEFTLALKINENNPHSLMYFANKALNNENPKKAINLLDKILIASPFHLDALALNYDAHHAVNDTNSAIEKIENAYTERSNQTSYRLLYARVLYKEGDFDKVTSLLKDIKSDGSTSATQWALLGSSYSSLKQNKKAMAVYDNWIEIQPKQRLAWVNKATLQEHLTDYVGALTTVEKALIEAPDDSQFSILRAHYLILTKKFNQAQMQISSLSNEQQKLPLVQGLQAKIWLTEGKLEQALSGLEGLYNLLPSPYNAALLFSSYRRLGQEEIAFSFIQKHIEFFPADNITRQLLAESAITYNKPLAIQHYLLLLKASPDSVSILNNLAWVEYQLANYSEAEKYSDKALKLNSEHPQVLATVGLIQLKLGNKQRAIELLNKAKQLSPNDDEIAKHLKEAAAQ
jgi:putative PEP-CTERM system TPR-repeat lipoprotein